MPTGRPPCAGSCTKTYEEVRRGSLGELAAWAAAGVRGEITVVVGGAPPVDPAGFDATDLVTGVRTEEAAGATRKEAIASVARRLGVAKRVVYDAVVAAKSPPETPT